MNIRHGILTLLLAGVLLASCTQTTAPPAPTAAPNLPAATTAPGNYPAPAEPSPTSGAYPAATP